MMLDQDVVTVRPASVYRVLGKAGLLKAVERDAHPEGHGVRQALAPHQHWPTDISYLNVCGTFSYLCSVLDGCSRSNLHWEIRESMKEREGRAGAAGRERRRNIRQAQPRLISDNGPARDFRPFVRLSGMDHVRTSPYSHPQSNGKNRAVGAARLKQRPCGRRRRSNLGDARRVVAAS